MGNWTIPRKKNIAIGVHCAQTGQRVHQTAEVLTRLHYRGVNATRARGLLTRDIARAFYNSKTSVPPAPQGLVARAFIKQGWQPMYINLADGSVCFKHPGGQARTVAAGPG